MIISTIIAISLYTATVAEQQRYAVECSVNDYVYSTSGYMSVYYGTEGVTEIVQYDSAGSNVNSVSTANKTYCETIEYTIECITEVADGNTNDILYFVTQMDMFTNTGVYALVAMPNGKDEMKTPDDSLLQSGTCEIVK